MKGYAHLAVPGMDQWNDDQVLAVYDLCQMISTTLRALHGDQLTEKMIALDDQHRDISDSIERPCEYQWPLPFDDTPPFDDPLS